MTIHFSARHFPSEIILLSVRYYLAYKLTYREIEEIMVDRGIHVDHSTINQWSSNALIVLPIIDDIFRDPNVEPPTLLERLIVPTIVISRVGMLFKMMVFGVIVFVRDLSNSLSV